MSSLSAIHLPRPKDWQDLERATRELFACVLGDPLTQLHGRLGQPQCGVDVYGRRGGQGGDWVGVQCKLSVDPITEAELKNELGKAERFVPVISEFHLVTTSPRDVRIQEIARQITSLSEGTSRPVAVRVWGWEDIEEEAAKHAAAHKAFDPTWNPYAEAARAEAKAGFGGLKEQLDALRPAADKSAPNRHDVDLFRQYRRLITPGTLEFLAHHDFGTPLRLSAFEALAEIAEGWLGARYEFVDHELQAAFEPVVVKVRELVDKTGERIFMLDDNPKFGTPKTYLDRSHGLTENTRTGIREMNALAHELWRALDAFERIGKAKIPI